MNVSETEEKREQPETDEKREHARITFLKAAACLSDEDIDYLLRIFSVREWAAMKILQESRRRGEFLP